VLNSDHTDVNVLGGRCWAKIPKYAKEAFMNHVGVAIPQKQHNNEDLGKVIANHTNAQKYKDDTTKITDKKASGGNAEMYRVINAIMLLISCYMNMKTSKYQVELDTRNLKLAGRNDT
jgi:hypothetical protein